MNKAEFKAGMRQDWVNRDVLQDRLDENPYIGITLHFNSGAIVINIRNQRMEQERHTAQTLDEAFDIIKVSAVTTRLRGV